MHLQGFCFLTLRCELSLHFIGSILQHVVHELSTLNSFAIMFRPNELGICLFNKQLKVVIKHWSLRNSLGKQYYVNNTSIYIWHRICISVHFKILICGLQISLTYYQNLVKSQFLRGNVCGMDDCESGQLQTWVRGHRPSQFLCGNLPQHFLEPHCWSFCFSCPKMKHKDCKVHG